MILKFNTGLKMLLLKKNVAILAIKKNVAQLAKKFLLLIYYLFIKDKKKHIIYLI